jgi:hypothetical protein
VPVPAGFRAVPHVDRVHHPERYYALARRLEESQRDYFTDEKLTDYRARFRRRRGARPRVTPRAVSRARVARAPHPARARSQRPVRLRPPARSTKNAAAAD